MSIIMVDYEDAYRRADKLSGMGRQCAELSKKLSELPEAASALSDFSVRFAAISADVRKGADIWEDFYRNNIRL